MSDVPDAPATPEIQPGVMSSLPKTRPQRPSARRASARRTASKQPEAADNGASLTRSARTKTARKKPPAPEIGKRPPAPEGGKKPREPKVELPRAPRQGFEAESEIETGSPVTPPGGVELAASVVELLGELAQSGLRSGERLLRDALLRRPSA
jgi:hypothetical protein